MEFSVEWFNDHLATMGQDFLWRKASMCPCVNPHSGAAKPNCPICSGKGRSWANPVSVKAGMASERVLRQWAQFGRYEAGDAILSVPESSLLYDAGQFDRITMLNATDPFSLVLVRGQNDKINFPVNSIGRVYWIINNSAVVEGGIPTVDNNGQLSWAAGAPPVGTQYSISGTRYSEYFVWDEMPGDRKHHYGARLPRKLVARRFDLFGR
jgi:hypothetical protein